MKLKFSSLLGFLFFLIPATKTYLVQKNNLLDNLFDLWSVLCIAALCVMIFRKSTKVPKEFKALFVFVLFFNFTTALNFPDQIMGALSESCRLLIVPLYLVYAFNLHQTVLLRTLRRIRKWYLFLLVLDSLTVFIQLAGVKLFEGIQYSLLGMDNYAAFSIVPMLTLILWSYYYEHGRFSLLDIGVYAVCFLAKLLTVSLTALMALAFMAVAIFLLHNVQGIKRIFTARNVLFAVIALFIGITVFKVQNLFEPFLLMLGKDATLNHRTVIWAKTINALGESVKNLLIGFGKTSGDEYKTIVGFSLLWDTQATHPHNFCLSILFSTGIVGLIIYAGMLSRTLKRMFYNRFSRATAILVSGCSAFFIIAFSDDYIMIPYFYTLLSVIALFLPTSAKSLRRLGTT